MWRRSIPRRIRRDYPDQKGDGVTKNQFLASRPRRMQSRAISAFIVKVAPYPPWSAKSHLVASRVAPHPDPGPNCTVAPTVWVWKVWTWVAPRVAPHQDLDPNCIVAPKVWVWKVWTSGLKSRDISRAKDRTASGFRSNFIVAPRLSRFYVQTFQTQTLGATMQFGSESGCGATLGATQVKTFQYSCPGVSDSNSRRNYATWVWIRMRCDPQRLDMSLRHRPGRGMPPLVIRIYIRYKQNVLFWS